MSYDNFDAQVAKSALISLVVTMEGIKSFGEARPAETLARMDKDRLIAIAQDWLDAANVKYADSDRIHICVDKIPGRPGSMSYARREAFVEGMTVKSYLAKVDHKGRAALNKAVRNGWITVSPV